MSHKYKIIFIALCLALCLLLTGCGKEAEPVPAAAPTATPVPTPDPYIGKLIVTEFMEKNRAVIADEDGDFSDWIELYNASNETIGLKGFRVSDSAEQNGWKFPDVSIAPGEHLLVFASNKEKDSSAQLHADFAISGDEGVYLKSPEGNIIFEALCGGCEADVAMQRNADGSWEQSLWPSPGYENSAEGYTRHQQSLMPSGELVINEAMCYDDSVLFSDWVEIKNVSGSTVRLSDYYLSDDDDNYRLFNLPAIDLLPGQCYVQLCDDAVTGFALSSEGEQLFLSRADATLLDFCSVHSVPYGCSYGRVSGEGGGFYFASPSPGLDNTAGGRTISQKPESLTKDGVYNNVESVNVELSAAGTIHYTLDGSAPTAASPVYTGPIALTETCVVRAVSIEENALQSLPLTLSFIINEGHSLPVLSLASDSPYQFQQMYDSKNKNVEAPGSISLYRENDSFTIGCGISLNGETSLIMPKKNMSLRFREAYGDATLEHDIYGGGVTEFTNLLLRSGQDYDHAIIRNELCQNICDMANLNVINQRSINCVLYINGEYAGLYTLKEKSNEQLYASLAGVSRNSVELEEANVFYDSPFYRQVISFTQLNDMSIPENYEYFCSIMDVDSLIDWLIIEGFCGNTDVTTGNLRYVRSTENDGKWRCMFYDLDATFSPLGSTYYNLMTEYSFNNFQIGAIVYPLTKNAQFKDRFLTRAAELYETVLTNETVLKEIDRMAAIVSPEVARDYARFERTYSDWQWDVNNLKETVSANNWRQLCIENLCFVFDLEDKERAHYFGKIDGK